MPFRCFPYSFPQPTLKFGFRVTLANLALLREVKEDMCSCVLSNLPVLMSYDKMQLGQNGAFRMHEQKERTVYNILGYATIIPFF